MTMKEKVPRRRRDPEATKAAILAAAFETFTERGYSGATMREVAKRAGVTHGLLRRHFGSKEALFLQALPGTRNWSNTVAHGGRAAFHKTSAAAFIDRPEAGSNTDVLVAMLRAGVDDSGLAGQRLYETVRQSALDLYQPILGGDDPIVISEVILSLMLGMTFTRHIMRSGALAEMDTGAFRELVEDVLRRLLDGS